MTTKVLKLLYVVTDDFFAVWLAGLTQWQVIKPGMGNKNRT